MKATLRTNYFQADGEGAQALHLVQIRPDAIPDLPEPRPKFEIFVYSPRVEACASARGTRRPALVGPPRRLPHRGPCLVKAQMVRTP